MMRHGVAAQGPMQTQHQRQKCEKELVRIEQHVGGCLAFVMPRTLEGQLQNVVREKADARG